MDSKNRFETRNTFLIYRLEYFSLLAIGVGLVLMHVDQVDWVHFAILFLYIDVIGYLPGAIAHQLTRGKAPVVFYYLYNFTHNLVTSLVVAALWAYFVAPEWALLAIPIHLCGDRSLFGNSMKSRHVSFEPVLHPAFAQFEQAYAAASPAAGGGAAGPASAQRAGQS